MACFPPQYLLLYKFSASILHKTLQEKIPQEVCVAMSLSHHASLQDVTDLDVMEQVVKMIASGGSLFTHSNNYLPKPSTKEHVREAAQMSDIILTRDPAHQHVITACSFSSAIPAQVGTRVDLYFYSNQCDHSVCFAHLHKTLQKLPSKITKGSDVGVQLHFPLLLDGKRVQTYMKDTLLLGERHAGAPFKGDRAVAYLLAIHTKSAL